LLLEEQIKYWEGKCMQELICGCVLCTSSILVYRSCTCP
jgi:hypothetical protein